MPAKNYNTPWGLARSRAMVRCNPKHAKYFPSYAARGTKCLITSEEVKALWFRDRADLMKRPSMDRIDNDGNYTAENCRFIELSENARRATRIPGTNLCRRGHENWKRVKKYLECAECQKINERRKYEKRKKEVKALGVPERQLTKAKMMVRYFGLLDQLPATPAAQTQETKEKP